MSSTWKELKAVFAVLMALLSHSRCYNPINTLVNMVTMHVSIRATEHIIKENINSTIMLYYYSVLLYKQQGESETWAS